MYMLKNCWAVEALGTKNANILHMLALLGHIDISSLQPKMRKVPLCKPLPCMLFQYVKFGLHSDKATSHNNAYVAPDSINCIATIPWLHLYPSMG